VGPKTAKVLIEDERWAWKNLCDAVDKQIADPTDENSKNRNKAQRMWVIREKRVKEAKSQWPGLFDQLT